MGIIGRLRLLEERLALEFWLELKEVDELICWPLLLKAKLLEIDWVELELESEELFKFELLALKLLLASLEMLLLRGRLLELDTIELELKSEELIELEL